MRLIAWAIGDEEYVYVYAHSFQHFHYASQSLMTS